MSCREGTVQVGDIIKFVDGQSVEKSELSVLRALVLGEVGTFVTLGFERGEPVRFT
jgi:C-terminal processing protease CtpA/Prc